MEKIINKLRKIKHINKELYNQIVKSEIDIESESIIDSYTLKRLLKHSVIDEKITDVIYDILEIKNSQNSKN